MLDAFPELVLLNQRVCAHKALVGIAKLSPIEATLISALNNGALIGRLHYILTNTVHNQTFLYLPDY